MGMFDGLRDRVTEELQAATGTPKARSVDNRISRTVTNNQVDKHLPEEKKIDRYWKLFKKVPIIRQPIRSFSQEVVAPGYYIDAESEEAREALEDWLENSAIISGEEGKDFGQLVKKITVQREVKGTAFVEKVYDRNDEDSLYGFKPMPAETMRAFTYPGQSLLLDPEADVENMDDLYASDIYTTDEGEVAAYVQFNSDVGKRDSYIPFVKDDVIKLERDADTGEIFGNSRLMAVEDRLESLLRKLEDNDKAIESLAHPFQLFRFGDEDDPWTPEEIAGFMGNHEEDDFEPGMKQGVQGNVQIETVSGEVAPIEEFLQFDVNWIISEMPLPKYALGGFEEDVNQFVSRSQETRVEQQIKEAREEVIEEWNPVIEEKARELGYADEFNELVIGTPPEEFDPKELREAEDGNGNVGAGGTDFTRPPASTEDSRQQNEESNTGEEQ